MFSALSLGELCRHTVGDVRDYDSLKAELIRFQPQIVMHLAAQPLVRLSYREPLATIETNVMGTANLLVACREVASVSAVVIVTSDKCYANKEQQRPYRETDSLGGYDPYSASKACAELVTDALRHSYFHPGRYVDHGVAVASARAGNVIGGGDWGADRIVPDAVRAFSQGRKLAVRRPSAVRPWQHVIDPLAGYLALARALVERGPEFASAWNFGPSSGDVHTVAELVESFAAAWGDGAAWFVPEDSSALHEAGHLTLDPALANRHLHWATRVSFDEAIASTAAWYRLHYSECGADRMRQLTIDQIIRYYPEASSS
jgi:CDP-glucose 4,6-dehydratase